MRVELRAGALHVYGYVNRFNESEPVHSPHGDVIERIVPGAFTAAIDRAENITLTVDHGKEVFASTARKTLKLHEDVFGLYAHAEIENAGLIESLYRRPPRGWSFGMANVVDELEARKNGLPLRKVKGFDMTHVSLVVDLFPVYPDTIVRLSEHTSFNEEYRLRYDALKRSDRIRRYEAIDVKRGTRFSDPRRRG